MNYLHIWYTLLDPGTGPQAPPPTLFLLVLRLFHFKTDQIALWRIFTLSPKITKIAIQCTVKQQRQQDQQQQDGGSWLHPGATCIIRPRDMGQPIDIIAEYQRHWYHRASPVEMHRTCPLQCSAEAEYFGTQAERVPKFGRIFLFYDE